MRATAQRGEIASGFSCTSLNVHNSKEGGEVFFAEETQGGGVEFGSGEVTRRTVSYQRSTFDAGSPSASKSAARDSVVL